MGMNCTLDLVLQGAQLLWRCIGCSSAPRLHICDVFVDAFSQVVPCIGQSWAPRLHRCCVWPIGGDSQQPSKRQLQTLAMYALQHASSRVMTDAAGLRSSQAPRWSKQKVTPYQCDGHSLGDAQCTSKHGQAAWCACRTAPGLNSVENQNRSGVLHPKGWQAWTGA